MVRRPFGRPIGLICRFPTELLAALSVRILVVEVVIFVIVRVVRVVF
jgi:hypothetical protein